MEPCQEQADDSPEPDGTENERPRHGNRDPRDHHKPDRNDGAGFGARHRQISEGKFLRLGCPRAAYVLKHDSPSRSYFFASTLDDAEVASGHIIRLRLAE